LDIYFCGDANFFEAFKALEHFSFGIGHGSIVRAKAAYIPQRQGKKAQVSNMPNLG
jgi:hypothetical protein